MKIPLSRLCRKIFQTGVILILLSLAPQPKAAEPAHPFFVSMTELAFNPKERALEISVRMFTDDLEKELAGHCRCKVNLGEEGASSKMEPVLAGYVEGHLKIRIDRKNARATWLGFQNEEESTWCFLEIKTALPGSLEVENRLLHETQEKQINLVRYKKPGFDKTIQLVYPDNKVGF